MSDDHTASIIDQFTRQAVPFSRMMGHSQSLDLMMELAGVTCDDAVLDVACGPGLVACAFAPHVSWVTGIDITPAMVERAKELQEEKELHNLTWQIGDVVPLPFPDGSFSLVLTRYSFHHFPDPGKVLAEMVRVCKPGGRVMVVDASVPSGMKDGYNAVEKLKDPSHTTVLTPDELCALAETNGLRDLRTAWYKLEMNLEDQLKGMFPEPGDDEKIRAMYRSDIGHGRLGMNVRVSGDGILFTYPVMIVVGKKMK